MSDRFILPIVPIVVLAVCLALKDAISARGWGLWLRMAATGIALVAIVAGGVGVTRGRPGVALAVNERQVQAHTLAYREVIMPWVEPGEDSWPKAFGITPWSRADALQAFLDHDVRCVVLFLGPSGDYRWLARAYPGDYVAKTMVTEVLPEVGTVTKLDDGIVITLADSPQI